MIDFAGKVVWITGAGSGVGEACALIMAQYGASVVLSGRRIEPLRDLAERITNLDGDALVCACDVADPEQTRATVANIKARYGRLDVYVGSAGYNINKRLMSNLSPTEAQAIMNVSLGGAFNASSAALELMREQNSGTLIHIGSWSGKRVRTFSGPAYTAAKAGLLAMSESMNLELADQGIRSTVIVPGGIDTPLLDNLPSPPSAEQRRRLLRVEDCAEAVRWVAALPQRVRIDELTITPTSQNV